MTTNVKYNDYRKSIAKLASGSIKGSKSIQIFPIMPTYAKSNSKHIFIDPLEAMSAIKSTNISRNQSPRTTQQDFSNLVSPKTGFITPHSANISRNQTPRPIHQDISNLVTPKTTSKIGFMTPYSLSKPVSTLTDTTEIKLHNTCNDVTTQPFVNTCASIEKIVSESFISHRIFTPTMTLLPRMSLKNTLGDRSMLKSAVERKGFFSSPDEFTKQSSEKIKLLHHRIASNEALELALAPELYYDEKYRTMIDKMKQDVGIGQKKIQNSSNIKSIYQI